MNKFYSANSSIWYLLTMYHYVYILEALSGAVKATKGPSPFVRDSKPQNVVKSTCAPQLCTIVVVVWTHGPHTKQFTCGTMPEHTYARTSHVRDSNSSKPASQTYIHAHWPNCISPALQSDITVDCARTNLHQIATSPALIRAGDTTLPALPVPD